MQGIAPSADAQYDGVPLDAPPSVRQGYGRVDLARALPLASNAPGWNLQVWVKHPGEPHRGLWSFRRRAAISTRKRADGVRASLFLRSTSCARWPCSACDTVCTLLAVLGTLKTP